MLVIACDCDKERFKEILEAGESFDEVIGYKLGFYLGLRYGLSNVARWARKFTDKTLIYDHQKAGTDVPHTASHFAQVCDDVDKVILFPLSGPAVEEEWIKRLREQGLGVIVGGLMSHPKFTCSEGGFIADSAVFEIYKRALSLGVREFVVPATKDCSSLLSFLSPHAELIYSPGVGAQGGAPIKNLCAIVGRSIYESEDVFKAIEGWVNKLSKRRFHR